MEKYKEKMQMEFIQSVDNKIGVEKLTEKIKTNVLASKKVLWFLTGGSNSQTCVDVYKGLVENGVDLTNVTVTLTDERYGIVGHQNSNWKKLGDLGFDFNKVKSIPVLTGADIEATTREFKDKLSKALQENEVIIGTFGVGADVHIAGILPNSVTDVTKEDLIISYKANDFERISIGFNTIRQIQEVFVFMFGESKKGAVESIKKGEGSIYEEPAQILHELPEVHIYTDQ